MMRNALYSVNGSGIPHCLVTDPEKHPPQNPFEEAGYPPKLYGLHVIEVYYVGTKDGTSQDPQDVLRLDARRKQIKSFPDRDQIKEYRSRFTGHVAIAFPGEW